MTKKVYIEGMSCGHCANRVEKALLELPGVKSVNVNLEDKFAEVTADTFPAEEAIKDAISDAGYDVVGIE
ncbi:MAG: heavy-metal-associated domain-containing protein [Candidatus Wallacebacter cryptica]|jgi:copper chaperone|nr:heavy-metal-associated domain-containing protein [Bacillota bacterium]